MGMFDEVAVPCPKCGTIELFQSKGGPCQLRVYQLDTAPIEVLADVNRHVHVCNCGTRFRVAMRAVAYPITVEQEELVDE